MAYLEATNADSLAYLEDTNAEALAYLEATKAEVLAYLEVKTGDPSAVADDPGGSSLLLFVPVEAHVDGDDGAYDVDAEVFVLGFGEVEVGDVHIGGAE